ncbi:ABC transporter substrate-binding protein [Acuticoccus mangrovi]|uniref:ABC transporter substrate-binding protein n=1 Tax=Acuticoccus mangrovi TaxID=2796142 RepID=A0A934IP08_9HYPH|nr:ABC transporter substrate-binding protein [Acuticoccus mangrovi]MBJ3778426.1 ABC transporter substrate-binding protein [Acuticoccus mangrovi]
MKTWMKSVLLASAVAAVCSHGSRADDLVIGARTEMASMDPHTLWSAATSQFYNHYLGYLVNIAPDNSVLPAIAESWEAQGDDLWVFKINPDAQWSDGTPIVASDVIASYERAINNPKGSYSGIFAGVDGFDAPDEHTLEIHTAGPYPTLPNMLTQVAVLPPSVIEGAEPGDFMTPKGNVGAAPYRFVEYVPGDHLTLERSETYFGDPALWDTVTFRFLTNPATRVTALLSGDVDMIDGVPPEDAAKLSDNPDFNVVSGPSDRVVFMTFDISRDVTPEAVDKNGDPLPENPFKDVRVRKAFALAINREAIAARAMDGMATPSNQIGTPTLGGFDPDYPPIGYDPEAAKKLLTEAGYPDGFGLTVACMNDRLVNDERICQIVAQMLQRIGIRTTVDIEPYSVFATKATCHCDDRRSFFMSTWASSAAGEVSMALLNLLHSYEPEKKLGTWNLGEYTNPALDEKIETLATVLDPDERHALEREAMRMAMDDYAVLPLHMQSVILAARKGLEPSVFGNEYTLANYVRPEGE